MIIGISGYAKSGKDTVAKIIQYINRKESGIDYTLEDALKDDGHDFILDMESRWVVKKFSNALKKIASLLTGIPERMFEDQKFKESFLGSEWHTPINTPLDDAFADVQFVKMMSVRAFLYQLPNWIFTDCRFPNEAKAIKDRGGFIIRIDRPGIGPVNNHPSETALDDWDFDYKIANVSDMESLKQTVQLVMSKIWQTN